MENQITLRSLGKSDIKITPIGLGCWQFSKKGNMAGKYWPLLEDELILDIIRISLQGGINWFDTAEVYGHGASEKILAKSLVALGKKPGDVLIATKWWPMFRFASNIIKTIDKRLACLNPFPIDLYQVHQPYSFSSEVKEMEAMAKLVQAKKIKQVGVSNFSASKMRNAWETLQKSGINLLSNQVQYSLLSRKIETNGVLDTAKELGITIIAYSPLAQGLVTGKFHDNPELLKNIGYRKHSSMFKPKGLEKSRPVTEMVKKLAMKYGATPSQIALNWLINFHGDTVVAIPGATKARHAEENTGTMKFRLSSEDMRLLDEVSAGYKK
ncbi:MAG: aldo/keto reductase [Bacteroidales bacterium]|jgi:aryl-alcohol dehydrogenase-like predicted oxidoreductase